MEEIFKLVTFRFYKKTQSPTEQTYIKNRESDRINIVKNSSERRNRRMKAFTLAALPWILAGLAVVIICAGMDKQKVPKKKKKQKKDSGSVQIRGIDADKGQKDTKRMIGVVFQDSVLDGPLTVKDSFKSSLPEFLSVSDKLINGTVAAQLAAALLA